MPYRRFDWHERIREVWGEYQSSRAAVDRLRLQIAETPDLRDSLSPEARNNLSRSQANLEGTYIVRLFAAFEAALRSYDRALHNDSTREEKAAVLIDQIGGKKARNIQSSLRQEAHRVLKVRHFWAHDNQVDPGPMSIDEARGYLQKFLSRLPEQWDGEGF